MKYMKQIVTFVKFGLACLLSLILWNSHAFAAGGCGSACLPLEALDFMGTQVNSESFRISLSSQYAEFDNFREGDSSVTNNGGNSAIIQDITLFLDYGITDRFTATLLLPYIKKEQTTNRFGVRTAEGTGDIALFGRYELFAEKAPEVVLGKFISPQNLHTLPGPSLSVGLGIKFKTGSIRQPGGNTQRLPPPFQNGTGAIDLIPTIAYFQIFDGYSLFGNAFYRVPTEENTFGYKFGKEFEVHFGVEYPIITRSSSSIGLDFTISLDYLHGDHDRDSEGIVPGRLRDGTKVLNTGGEFLDITPGITIRPSRQSALQLRLFFPVFEDWNGDRATNVGQVAPDITYQLTFNYSVE